MAGACTRAALTLLGLYPCFVLVFQIQQQPMSIKEPIRKPTLATDADGTTIFLVPVSGTCLPARILPEDWEELQRQGYSTKWHFSTAAVHSRRPTALNRSPERLSRVLLGITDSRTFVRYHDRNPLNLRRENLYPYLVKTAEQRDRELSSRRYRRLVNGLSSISRPSSAPAG